MVDLLGTIAFLLLTAYVILWFIKYSHAKNLDSMQSGISETNMPILKPLPILTANQDDTLDKLIVMIFSIRKWQLQKAFVFEHRGRHFVIPAGFEFDGASIPKILWAIVSPVGLFLIPGLIHDFGYRYNGIFVLNEQSEPVWDTSISNQEEWDDLFQDIGDDVNQFPLLNAIANFALWLGGFAAWTNWRDEKLPKPEFLWQLDEISDADQQVKEESSQTRSEPKSSATQKTAAEDDDSDVNWQSGTTKTTQIGYVNPKQQRVCGTRKKPASETQFAYKVHCEMCGHSYGVTGSELYRCTCPNCQDGKTDIEY